MSTCLKKIFRKAHIHFLEDFWETAAEVLLTFFFVLLCSLIGWNWAAFLQRFHVLLFFSILKQIWLFCCQCCIPEVLLKWVQDQNRLRVCFGKSPQIFHWYYCNKRMSLNNKALIYSTFELSGKTVGFAYLSLTLMVNELNKPNGCWDFLQKWYKKTNS